MPLPAGLQDAAVGMHFFYLHGFASSPDSGKARFFRDRLAERGIALAAPDFNGPDFDSLTVTRMLGQLDAAIDRAPAGPVALIGSSLEGSWPGTQPRAETGPRSRAR